MAAARGVIGARGVGGARSAGIPRSHAAARAGRRRGPRLGRPLLAAASGAHPRPGRDRQSPRAVYGARRVSSLCAAGACGRVGAWACARAGAGGRARGRTPCSRCGARQARAVDENAPDAKSPAPLTQEQKVGSRVSCATRRLACPRVAPFCCRARRAGAGRPHRCAYRRTRAYARQCVGRMRQCARRAYGRHSFAGEESRRVRCGAACDAGVLCGAQKRRRKSSSCRRLCQ